MMTVEIWIGWIDYEIWLWWVYMKTCPNCGSVLADNEPYCENCGYDPDFDLGGYIRKPSHQRKNARKPSNPKSSDGDLIGGIFLLAVLIFCAWMILQSYSWNIVSLILDNLDSVFAAMIAIPATYLVLNFISQLWALCNERQKNCLF